jgi:succinate dehydrogenase/fumarate reductase cytochrome b subunit
MSKKKYSINWEDDLPVSFEVNGRSYESLEDVPDEADRRKLEAMMDSSFTADFDKEFEEASKQLENQGGPSMENIVLGIFTVVAVIMLIVTAVSSYSAISKISKEESAPGRVVDMIEKREYVNEQDRIIEEYYYPVVEYVSADGRGHTVQLTEGSSTPSYEIGDEVTVLYDPEHPLDARIKSFGSSALMWVLPSITGILGLGFLVAVIVVRRVMGTEESN